MARLPNWSLLLAFEAVARHRGFTRAATELNVQQPAMSRRVAKLEAELGVELLVRAKPRLALTAKGEVLYRAIAGGLVQVQAAIDHVAAERAQGAITLDVTIGFASCFLLARLNEFRAAFPERPIELISRDRNEGWSERDADAVFVFDHPDAAPGRERRRIFDERLVAMCAPGYARSLPMALDRLGRERLLRLSSSVHSLDWRTYFEGSGAEPGPARAEDRFTSFMVYLQAGLNGDGVILGWATLMDDHLLSGALVRAAEREVATTRGYFCFLTDRGAQNPGARAFLDWVGGLCP